MQDAVNPKMKPGDKLLTPQQVADRLCLSKREAYNLIAEDHFDIFYPNGYGRRPVRVYESSLVLYIERNSVRAGLRVTGDGA